MSTELVSMDQMAQMAKSLVASKMFGFKTEAEALSIMLIAQAEGRSPALAARDYHVIQGRPALKADAMLARFQAEGGVVEWVTYTDAKVTGAFSHPKSCPKPVVITWTIEMAKRIGLATRENWRNYPRAMLRSRVVSEGVRTAYPGVTVGVYSVEEVQDMQKEKDITPSSGVAAQLTIEEQEKCTALADKMREWLNSGSLTDAWAEMDNAALGAEEQIYLWTHFDSRIRRQLKEEGERQRIKNQAALPAPAKISDAQRKRLEARISEAKVSRDAIKAYCKEKFGADHFKDLTKEQYDEADTHIDFLALKAEPPSAGQSVAPCLATTAPVDSAPIPDDDKIIGDVDAWIVKRKFKAAADIASFITDADKKQATLDRIQAAFDLAKGA